MNSDLAGLVAVVTGGGSGIGLATATLLSDLGARVAVLDLNIDTLPESCYGFTCDVTDSESVHSGISKVVRELGRIDILVNNAGIGAVGTVEESNEAEWLSVLDVNVIGLARVSAAALPYLRQSDAASIVNVCSVAALSGLPQRAVYSASKGAVYSLTLAMATDHIREGIRVNCVSPGTADTPWVGRLLDDLDDPAAERAALNARQATGRLVKPEEVAAAIAFLASPNSASVTGSELLVDGGLRNLRVRA